MIRGGSMKRVGYILGVLLIIGIGVSLSAKTGRDNLKGNYLVRAKEEIAKGNIELAKEYLEKCFSHRLYAKEAKELYSQLKDTKPTLTKKTKSKPIEYTVVEYKEVLPPEKEELPAVQTAKTGGERVEILWEDFNSGWGLYGINPPSGWTIIDNGDESPATWNTNDWYRYYYDAVHDSVARVYYSPSENQEEWLITPTLNIPAATCSLKFWHYYWDCSTYDSAYVLGSINDGSSWTETIALFNSDHFGQDTAFDITSWASGESQVKIAFLYYGNYDWYWMVDECSVATYVTYPYDLGVIAILNPPDSVPQGRRPWPTRAVIRNFGTNNVRRFWIHCTFGSNNPYHDSLWYSAWLNAGDTAHVSFTNWDPQNMGTDTMTVCHDGDFDGNLDQDRSNDTLSNQVKVIRAYFTGGPDTYGYSWIDSDTAGGPTYSWINASGGTACSFTSIDDYEKVALPFPFRFYENTYDSIYICTNGFVSFGAGYTSYSNTSIPSTSTPNNAIYVHWDDMDPISAGDVYYKTLTGPDRFAIIWQDVPHYSNIGAASFEIILYDNGGILLQYNDVNFGNASYNFGRSATVGIENSTGSIGLEYLYNWDPYGNLLLPQRAIDWPCNDTPSPPIIYPLFQDLDGNFPVYWTPSIDRDGIAGYQLDEVTPDTLLYDQANANGVFTLSGFTRSNTRYHSPNRSYGSSNVSSTYDTMTSVNSYSGATSVDFWWWGGIENGIDDGYFDISIDGGSSWINVGYYTGNDSTWYHEVVDVSAYSGFSIYLRFRYESDGSLNYGGFWVDDILVNGWQWVQTFSSSIGDTTYNVTGASPGWHYYHCRGEDNLSNWGNWGNVEDIWIGVNDAPSITVLTPANDTIVTGTTYQIQWTDSDPDNDASVSLYYDTDNTGYDGTLITSGISENDPNDFFDWNVGAVSGRYYIYGMIDDGINAPVYDYSPATLTIGDLLKVSTDWIAMYMSNDATMDADAGTYTSCTEPSHPYGVDVTLLYGGGAHNPWSTYNTIRSHETNNDYVTRDAGATTESGYTVVQMSGYYNSAWYSGPEAIVQQWVVDNGQDDFEVEQEIAAEGMSNNSRLRVTTTLTNRANGTRTFSFRYQWDIHVDDEDAAWIRAYFGASPDPWEPYERYWETNSTGLPISLEEARDDAPGPSAIVHFLSVQAPVTATPPDTLYYVGWSMAYGSAFQVPFPPPDSLCGSLDAAVCYLWLDRDIPQDGSVSFTQYLLTSNPTLSISLTEFTATYAQNTNDVQLLWRTESEENNLGFNLYRALGEGEYEKVNEEIIEGGGNSSSPIEYRFRDSEVSGGNEYNYQLEQVDINGNASICGNTSIDLRDFLPLVSSLKPIYPNPLTTKNASIPFVVGLRDGSEDISIRIFDVTGRVVRTLLDGRLEPGFYSVRWDTKNTQGRRVPSGVYYTLLSVGKTREIKKLVLIK
jgi:hypothetical protein